MNLCSIRVICCLSLPMQRKQRATRCDALHANHNGNFLSVLINSISDIWIRIALLRMGDANGWKWNELCFVVSHILLYLKVSTRLSVGEGNPYGCYLFFLGTKLRFKVRQRRSKWSPFGLSGCPCPHDRVEIALNNQNRVKSFFVIILRGQYDKKSKFLKA